MTDMNMRERLARAIASGLGDSYEHAFASKTEWNQASGEKGGRFRDINEPFTNEYDEAADAVLDELMTPTEGMLTEGVLAYELIGIAGGIINTAEDHLELILQAMIKAAKEGE